MQEDKRFLTRKCAASDERQHAAHAFARVNRVKQNAFLPREKLDSLDHLRRRHAIGFTDKPVFEKNVTRSGRRNAKPFGGSDGQSGDVFPHLVRIETIDIDAVDQGTLCAIGVRR